MNVKTKRAYVLHLSGIDQYDAVNCGEIGWGLTKEAAINKANELGYALSGFKEIDSYKTTTWCEAKGPMIIDEKIVETTLKLSLEEFNVDVIDYLDDQYDAVWRKAIGKRGLQPPCSLKFYQY